MSFELVGVEDGVTLQVAVREEDESLFLSALRTYFPGTIASPSMDALARFRGANAEAEYVVLHVAYGREAADPGDLKA